MNRLILIAVSGVLLSSCTPGSPFSAARVYEARASYDAAVLVPAARYASLPLCTVHAPPCSEVSIIRILQGVDAKADVAIEAAVGFVRANPGANATSYINAVVAAVSAAQNTALQYGIKP